MRVATDPRHGALFEIDRPAAGVFFLSFARFRSGPGTSMGRSTVFVVGADDAVRDSIKTLVESAGLKAEAFPSLRAFVDAVEPGRRGCLVFEARADDLGDREALATLTTACSRMPVLLIADRGDVRTAVRALKAGATDIVQKPYKNQNLLDSIEESLRASEAAGS